MAKDKKNFKVTVRAVDELSDLAVDELSDLINTVIQQS